MSTITAEENDSILCSFKKQDKLDWNFLDFLQLCEIPYVPMGGLSQSPDKLVINLRENLNLLLPSNLFKKTVIGFMGLSEKV